MSEVAQPANGESKRRPILAHPADIHLVVFHGMVLLAYVCAFWIYLHPESAGLESGWEMGAFVAGAALLLGWLSGVEVGVAFHNHAHRRIFTRPWMNRWFGRTWTVSGGWPAYLWQYSHVVVHHRHLMGARDWTLPKLRADGSREGFFAYCFLHWPWRYWAALWAEFRSERASRGVRRRALKETLLFVPLFSIPFWIDWQAALWLWVLPAYLANVLVLAPAMVAQHSGREAPSDTHQFRHSNVFLSRVFNLTMFQIGYHAEHHTYPFVHWSELPELHDTIKDELVEEEAHVVPFGYYRGALLLSRAALGSKKSAREFESTDPSYLPYPSTPNHP